MLPILLNATYETLKVVFITTTFSILFGMPLGLFLEASNNPSILSNNHLWIHKTLIILTNFFYNTPIFLLLITLTPIIDKILFNKFTVEFNAIIALTIINIFIFGKDVFNALNTLPKELSDTAMFLGADPLQVLTKFLLPESTKSIINKTIKLIINLFGLTILISGTLEMNGLGKLILEKTYKESDFSYAFYIILLSLTIIYLIKIIGDYIIDFIYNHK